ncbi:hypothetical protein DF114_34645 [Burkholderia stagnalis]|nr:hypothetical protein DF163_34885 [Burkholderia stagnalis]RQQ21670.1 hypothetical protein DF149_34365 [Burkholderia stagnalis]RQY09354.1 hypothetical protein DF117_35385 [Burkholderia stagnalis]RQY22044.1 hypothetical protein DF114_34645 [Burkholderia stagnalis]RQY29629.1 hypothetical protein DF113_34470 [Burkholderia stagnalis]
MWVSACDAGSTQADRLRSDDCGVPERTCRGLIRINQLAPVMAMLGTSRRTNERGMRRRPIRREADMKSDTTLRHDVEQEFL